jgi:predicted enzyme related to lactoylglutathione lyase
MQNNPVVFWELASHDAEKTVAFLEEIFDWDIHLDEPSGIYEIPADRGGPAQPAPFTGGGVFTLRKARLPFLTLYIRVEDIEDMAKRVEELGGLIVIPPEEVVPGSRICLFNEPSGVTLAMLERIEK